VAQAEALVTRRQAAHAAGVTYNTILLWIRAGRLHPVDHPTLRRVIRLSELTSALERGDWLRRRQDTIWGVQADSDENASTRTDLDETLPVPVDPVVAGAGLPVQVFVSGAGRSYHATPLCPLLKWGQERARERGHVVRKVNRVAMVEAEADGRRACRGCIRSSDATVR